MTAEQIRFILFCCLFLFTTKCARWNCHYVEARYTTQIFGREEDERDTNGHSMYSGMLGYFIGMWFFCVPDSQWIRALYPNHSSASETPRVWVWVRCSPQGHIKLRRCIKTYCEAEPLLLCPNWPSILYIALLLARRCCRYSTVAYLIYCILFVFFLMIPISQRQWWHTSKHFM